MTAALRAYRLLLRCYPRSFRDEYGDDMVALLAEQFRDEHAARVAVRAAIDLAITIPARHLEVHMSSTSTTALLVTFVTVGAALAVVGGPTGVAAGAVLFGLAVLAWRRNRPVIASADGRWWKLLAGGVALLGSLIVITTLTGELPTGGWFVAMATGLTSLGLIGAGIILGIAAWSGTRTA